MNIRVQQVCEDFQTIDEAWARTAEIGISIDDINTIGPRTRQFGELRIRPQNWEILLRPFGIETATGDHQDLGIACDDVIPTDFATRLAVAADALDTARQANQFG